MGTLAGSERPAEECGSSYVLTCLPGSGSRSLGRLSPWFQPSGPSGRAVFSFRPPMPSTSSTMDFSAKGRGPGSFTFSSSHLSTCNSVPGQRPPPKVTLKLKPHAL